MQLSVFIAFVRGGELLGRRRDERTKLRRRGRMLGGDDHELRALPVRRDELSLDVLDRRGLRRRRLLFGRGVRRVGGERRNLLGFGPVLFGQLRRRRLLRWRVHGAMRGVQRHGVGRHLQCRHRSARGRSNGVRRHRDELRWKLRWQPPHLVRVSGNRYDL